MLLNVADIIGLIFCSYLIIGWITSVMLFVLYLCKKRYRDCEVPVMYMFIWPKLYITLAKLIKKELKNKKENKKNESD